MSALEKILDGLMRVIRMNDKVEALTVTVIQQHARLEDVTARVIRLETALEIALSKQATRAAGRWKALPPSDR